MTKTQSSDLNVQYGCGLCAPDEWLNFDTSPTLLLQRVPIVGPIITKNGPQFPKTVQYGNIVRGLPLNEQSCSIIYCSHILEHLALDDFRVALKNTYSYLMPGGRFRFVLPDLETLVNIYCKSTTADAAIKFMEETCLGMPTRPKGIVEVLRILIGNNRHLWMWDFKSIVNELESVGFTNIRRAYHGDSGLEIFKDVEDIFRWRGCLGIECFR